MTIEVTLQSIDNSLKALLVLAQNKIPENESGIAGAGAEAGVAAQVGAAIAAAGTGTPEAPKRGRGRPSKTAETPTATETAADTGQRGSLAAAFPAASVNDPFATDDSSAPVEPTRTLDDVRTSLIVYQSKNDQTKALGLLKQAAGVDNLTQLKPDDYNKVFVAAIPSGKIDLNDVKSVLVAANTRSKDAGLKILADLGAKDATGTPNIKFLTEDKFYTAITAAHKIKAQ